MEPQKIFLTKKQIIDLARLILFDRECKNFNNDYIFELQQIDQVGLDVETKCLGSYCDDYDLIWNDYLNWWQAIIRRQ
jgi:hypothetical protein